MSSAADERVEFRGQSWFVADAQYDEAPGDVGSHWHLTLTAPTAAESQLSLLREAIGEARVILSYADSDDEAAAKAYEVLGRHDEPRAVLSPDTDPGVEP